MTKEKLILTIIEQPHWGYVIQPVWVSEDAPNSLSILEIADTKSSYFNSLTTEQQDIIKYADGYSVKKLMKNFSKEKNTANFLKTVTEKTIETYIRPCIERLHKKIMDLLPQSELDVYFRENVKKRTLFDFEKIYTSDKTAQVIFNFDKHENEPLSYHISIKWQDFDIELHNKFYAVLCNDPAIVLIDNNLVVFEDIDAKKLIPFFSKEYVSIPASSEKAYIEKFVVNCFKNYQTNIQGIDIHEINVECTALLSLTNGWDLLPVLSLEFEYAGNRYPIDSSDDKKVFALTSNNKTSLYWFYKNKEKENYFINLLIENNLEKTGLNGFRVKNSSDGETLYSLIEWIQSHPDTLKEFSFYQDMGQKKYYLDKIVMNSSINTGQDWFDIKCDAVFGDFRIPFIRFKNHILNDIREYILPDGSIAVLPDEWFTKYHELMFFGKKNGNDIILQKQHFQVIDLFDTDKNHSLVNLHLHDIFPVPDGINATLRQYQQKGYSWLIHLYNENFGGCLADDMGLGKTLQTIALLQYIFLLRKKAKGKKAVSEGQLSIFNEDNLTRAESGQYPPSLIVVPTSLLYNWMNEIKRFTPEQKIYMYSGEKRMRSKDLDKFFRLYDIILTTYGTLRIDIEMLSLCQFHHFILDESQYVKNPDSITYKAVKRINSLYKLALTGTPIENSLSDLWAQFNIINEGMLGTQDAFQKTYINPINRNNKQKEEALLKIIQPFILRRTKNEVAPELPPLTEETIYCDMSELQQERYNKEKNRLRNSIIEGESLHDPSKFAFMTLQGLTRLRLLANHPVFVDPEYTGNSGKFEQVTMYLENLKNSNHKVLVFSSFVKHLKLFAHYLDERKWKYAWLTGETGIQDREKEINKYMNDNNVNCFFISLKAGGVGLNLTAADYVFILDPWWNPAAEMQAVSRSHRIGQNKNVMVYRFISSGSIEEKIRMLQENKSKLADTFISSTNPLNTMSKNEIEELFN